VDSSPSWQSTVIGLAFVGLVALMFWQAVDDFNHFSVIWAGVGSIVGVVTGALPGYFFGRAGHQAAREASKKAEDASLRAELYAAHMPIRDRQVVVDTIMRTRPR
jgi:membrane protein DedA with SNARE-associated domain